jgi:peptidoglycan/xylan/chitin deacetylase (PgdA/CDA1 family)
LYELRARNDRPRRGQKKSRRTYLHGVGQDVLEMAANGIQIGSHTVSHADLTKLSAEELRRQMQESKLTPEALLGHPVLDFCYPSGAVNPTVLQAAQAAGYETATTTAGDSARRIRPPPVD